MNQQQKRRKYSTRACVFCRNRHKKCDGGQPCMACDQRKQECLYPEQQKKRGPKPRSSKTTCSQRSSGVEPQLSRSSKRRRLSNDTEESLPKIPLVEAPIFQGDNVKFCEILGQILKVIQQQPRASPFLHPVKTSVAPGYYDIIKNPMDLDTMYTKTRDFQYFTLESYLYDFSLMVENCKIYNQDTPSSYLIGWAQELYQQFIEEIKKRSKLLDSFSPTVLYYPHQMEQVEQMDQIEPIEQSDHFDLIDQTESPLITKIEQIESPDSIGFDGQRGSLHFIIDQAAEEHCDLKVVDDSWELLDYSIFSDNMNSSPYYDQHESFDLGKYVNLHQ